MDHECGSCSEQGCTGLCKAPGEDSRLRRALNERDRLAHALREVRGALADAVPALRVGSRQRQLAACALDRARAALAEVER